MAIVHETRAIRVRVCCCEEAGEVTKDECHVHACVCVCECEEAGKGARRVLTDL